MKRIHAAFLAGALMTGCSAAMAVNLEQPDSSSSAQSSKMVVAVAVDAQGNVVRAKHLGKLPASVEKLLRENLDSWVVGPATMWGRVVPKWIMVTVAVTSAKRSDGTYETGFAFISADPVPKPTYFDDSSHQSWASERGDYGGGGATPPDQYQH